MLQSNTESQIELTSPHPVSNALNPQENLRTDAQRVLILHSGILLDELIAGLLDDEADLQVSIIPIDNEETIAQAIAGEKPQTVILCNSDWFSVAKLYLMLETINYSEALQIVVFALNENSMEVFSKEKIITKNFRHFVGLIKNNGGFAH